MLERRLCVESFQKDRSNKMRSVCVPVDGNLRDSSSGIRHNLKGLFEDLNLVMRFRFESGLNFTFDV